jgi:hypothetical protein
MRWAEVVAETTNPRPGGAPPPPTRTHPPPPTHPPTEARWAPSPPQPLRSACPRSSAKFPNLVPDAYARPPPCHHKTTESSHGDTSSCGLIRGSIPHWKRLHVLPNGEDPRCSRLSGVHTRAGWEKSSAMLPKHVACLSSAMARRGRRARQGRPQRVQPEPLS